jgi:hypothetical protein
MVVLERGRHRHVQGVIEPRCIAHIPSINNNIFYNTIYVILLTVMNHVCTLDRAGARGVVAVEGALRIAEEKEEEEGDS